jgi:hypothetical protein
VLRPSFTFAGIFLRMPEVYSQENSAHDGGHRIAFFGGQLKSPKSSLDGAPSGVGGFHGCLMRARPHSYLALDNRAPAGFFLPPASRALLFSSVVAESCLVRDTNVFDSWTTSASFAFTRLVISRLSPVFGMCHPFD